MCWNSHIKAMIAWVAEFRTKKTEDVLLVKEATQSISPKGKYN
jgi:hypothetical protein